MPFVLALALSMVDRRRVGLIVLHEIVFVLNPLSRVVLHGLVVRAFELGVVLLLGGRGLRVVVCLQRVAL